MKLVSGLCLGLLLAGLGAATPGHAEGLPSGSYLNSCNGVRVEGASLVGRCPRIDGTEQRSALLNFDRCAGDIVNDNGVLSCTFRTATEVPVPAAPPPPQVVTPAAVPVPVPAAPPPSKVVTPVADRCGELHGEARGLNERLDRAIDPLERAHLEGRLQEVHRQQDGCP